MPFKLALPLLTLALVPFLLVPAGCGGSGGSAGTPAAANPTPDGPVELQAKGALTLEDKTHFLQRTHFAFNPPDLAKLDQMGFAAYLDWMLTMTVNHQLEADALAATVVDPAFPAPAEISRWWLHLMINNPNPFQEVLAMFWHDHFAASTEVLPAEARWWAFNHVNLWRYSGLVDLGTLLHAMSIDWVMLEWLDGVRSPANNPNENFAREFWELFTLGADNGYTQQDIVHASRCFTGFRTRLVANRAGTGRDQLIVEFAPGRHNNSTKVIFGHSIPPNGAAEYMDVVQLTLAQRPVAEFICRKVWEGFVYEKPSAEIVDGLAKHLRDNNYNLKELFRLVFSCNAFYSDQAKAGLVKTPVDHVMGFIRATGLAIVESRLDGNLVAIGQRPTQPPTVNGWPGGDFWLSAQGMLERINFLRDAVFLKNEAPQAGYDVGVLIDPVATAADEVVDQLAARMRLTLLPTQRDEYIDYLNTDRLGNGNIISQTWDISDAIQRDKKIRGLLYLMGQHPTYAIR